MMPVEALETGIYSLLSGDASLITELGGTAIYNKRAPQSPPEKYVIFQWQGGGDENETPNRTRNVVYAVFGVAATQADAAGIDSAIDAALHQSSVSVSGWTNFWTAREEDVNLAQEDAGGVTKYQVGGLYRIRIDLD